jgi:hypothetical protein
MSDEQGPPTTGTPVEDEIRAVLERARGGDPEALPAAREALDADPGIWRAYGDLAAHARRSWIELIAGRDLVLRESLGRKLAEMQAELSGPAPSPLEVLLVGRIGVSWLEASYADAAAARAGEVSVKQADFLRKRQDSAHRRHLTAIAALAAVRRLLGTTGGPAVRLSKAASPSIAPGNEDGGDRAGMGLGDREATPVEGDHAAEGLVLGFGLHRDAKERPTAISADARGDPGFRRGLDRSATRTDGRPNPRVGGPCRPTGAGPGAGPPAASTPRDLSHPVHRAASGASRPTRDHSPSMPRPGGGRSPWPVTVDLGNADLIRLPIPPRVDGRRRRTGRGPARSATPGFGE